MLASLLPALRDLRAPLASGYLWLTFAWACFASQVRDAVRTNASLHSFASDSGAFGGARLWAVMTFVAFLIGAILNVSSRGFINLVVWYWDPIWEATVGRFLARLRRSLHRGPSPSRLPVAGRRESPRGQSRSSSQPQTIGGLHVSWIAHRHLLAFIQGRPGGLEFVPRDADFNDTALRDRARPVYDEIPQLAIRLAKDQPALFDAYDRAHAEADFRVTVALPLLALGVRLLWVWWPVGVLLLAGTPFMFAAAVTKERDANDVVIEAVCIDAVQSEAVNKLLGREHRAPGPAGALPRLPVRRTGLSTRATGRADRRGV